MEELNINIRRNLVCLILSNKKQLAKFLTSCRNIEYVPATAII